MLAINSCYNNNIEEDIPPKDELSNSFFANNIAETSLKNTNDDPDFRLLVIDFLKYIDDSTKFSKEFAEIYGSPLWDVVSHIGEEDRKAWIVPVNDNSSISALWLFTLIEDRFEYNVIFRDDCDIDDKERYNRLFDYYEYLAFNKQPEDIEFISPEKSLKGLAYVHIEICVRSRAGGIEGLGYYYNEDCYHRTEIIRTNSRLSGRRTNRVHSGSGRYFNGGNRGGSSPRIRVPEPETDKIKSPKDEWIETKDFENSKAKCTKDKLIKGLDNSILGKLIKGYKGKYSKLDLVWKVSNLPSGINARIKPAVWGNNIKITIDREYSETASSLELARTILHESFHAYILGKLKDAGKFNTLMDEPNFQFDLAEYSLWQEGQSQHVYMANNYLPSFVSALSDFIKNEPYYNNLSTAINNKNLTIYEFLKVFVWNGLHKTDEFKEKMKDPKFRLNRKKVIEITSSPIVEPEDCIE